MREVNGRMRFGRIAAQIVELHNNSKALALILGYWNVVMGLRAEFIIALSKMIVLWIRRFLLKGNGA